MTHCIFRLELDSTRWISAEGICPSSSVRGPEVFYLRPADLSFWWIPLFNGSDSRSERDGNRFGPYIILISKGERDD